MVSVHLHPQLTFPIPSLLYWSLGVGHLLLDLREFNEISGLAPAHAVKLNVRLTARKCSTLAQDSPVASNMSQSGTSTDFNSCLWKITWLAPKASHFFSSHNMLRVLFLGPGSYCEADRDMSHFEHLLIRRLPEIGYP